MFKKLLVPLDGSELAAKILPQVEGLAKAFDAQLTLITVGSAEVGEIEESSPEAMKEAIAKLPAVSYLKQTASALKSKGINVTWVYKQGMPAREIIAYAADHQVDLIAMGTHGAGEVAWVLGSVAEKVVSHAPVPVLLLRVLEAKPPILKSEIYYLSH
ncbi:MAG: universal stress protein [Deltaproteobacteria bacterium]|nr:universal stress protein [Deltaproteobacteria bacterium]MBI4795176.1 universal stress protein [Deltaproteobacteria bacterium]